MKITQRLTEIPKSCWQAESQLMELDVWKNAGNDGDDWNNWWAGKFDNYSFLINEDIKNICEVGCGPYAKNIQFVTSVLNTKPINYFLNDPLLNEYINLDKSVKTFASQVQANINAEPLEEYTLEEKVDCIICVNVLDHVYSLDKCFNSMYANLKPNGILILGQDLTNDYDFDVTPKEDPWAMMHPIRVDYNDIKPYLIQKYTPIFDKILPREESRASYNHYGTLLFAGKKI